MQLGIRAKSAQVGNSPKSVKVPPFVQRCENRRMAAIEAADIAVDAHLIGKDEEDTIRALRAH